MKLLLASSSFHGGGITSYAHEVIEHYSKVYVVSVLVGDDSHYPITTKGVNVYHYDTADCTIKNAKIVLNIINNEIKPDIIVSSNSQLISFLAPYLNSNIKLVTISHSLRYTESDVAAFNHKYVNNIIALSEYNKNNLVKKFKIKDENKVSVVYNFVKEENCREQLLSQKLQRDIPTIVFSGGGAPSKSPEIIYIILIELLKTNLKFKFYWLGGTTPPFKKVQPFKDIRNIVPLDERVVFTGRIPREDAEKIIAGANIFLTPSRREGCPMAMLEAMRVGSVIVTSDYKNACKEMISDGISGYVIPHNKVDTFVKVLSSILKQPMINTAALCEQSYRYFEENCTYVVWKQKMDSILSDQNHSRKYKTHFSSLRFLFDRFRFFIMDKFNLLHMIYFEIWKSAKSFLKYYRLYNCK